MTSYRSERTSNARSLRHRRTKPSLALPGRDAFSLCHSSPSSSILGSYNRASIAQDHFTTSPQVCGSSPGRRGARSGIQGQPALTTCSDRHFAPNAPYGFGNISIAFKSSATCGYPQRQVSSPLIAHAPRGKHFARLLPRVCERSRPATPLEDNPCLRHDMTRSTRLSTPIQSTKASYTQLGRVRVAVRQTEGGNEATKREGRAFKKIRLRDWSVNAPSTFFFFRSATFFFFFSPSPFPFWSQSNSHSHPLRYAMGGVCCGEANDSYRDAREPLLTSSEPRALLPARPLVHQTSIQDGPCTSSSPGFLARFCDSCPNLVSSPVLRSLSNMF